MYLNSSKNIDDGERASRLTLTWDVFKFIFFSFIKQNITWLTLTWDVFKF